MAGEFYGDHLYQCPAGDLACLLYSVDEIRMGWDVAYFAHFRDKARPRIILNPKGLRPVPRLNDSVTFPRGRDVVCTKIHVYRRHHGSTRVPFCLFDVMAESFAILPVENSDPYRVDEAPDGTLILRQEQQDASVFPSRDGETFRLNALGWHVWRDLFSHVEICNAAFAGAD